MLVSLFLVPGAARAAVPLPVPLLRAVRRARLKLMKWFFVCLLGVLAPVGAAAAATMPSIAVPVLAATPSMSGQIDATWKGAKSIRLSYDFTNRRTQRHPPVVYIAQDAAGLDVAFVVRQHSIIRAATVSNGSGVYNDDYVGVSLNPQGQQGFSYGFFANARGVRTQASSENSSYSPDWVAAASRNRRGYVVTMRIPFNILRTGASHVWSVQFLRYAVQSNATDVWTYNPDSGGPADPLYEGMITGVMPTVPTQKASRPRPRFQPYLLAVAGSKNAGGSTSQMGLDLAIPITPTASFLGSVHPDYSNVETDQQSISPTAFARQFSEVRPLFTQLSGYFNNAFGCLSCPQSLYTVAIPTYRQAYGIEGTQGPLSVGGFTAVGTGRTDSALALNFSTRNTTRALSVNVQRVLVNTASFTDTTTTVTSGVLLGKSHLSAYANYGRENGTFVTDPTQGHYGEVGVGYFSQQTTALVARQFIGAQYSPVDGYVAQTDTGGYEGYAMHTFTFSSASKVRDVQVSANVSRLWNHRGALAQAEAGYQASLDLKNLISMHLYQTSQSVLGANGEFLPYVAGNGAFFGYNLSSNTPVGIGYSEGQYFHGRAQTWQAFDTYQLKKRISVSLQFNENIYASNAVNEPSFRQWLNTVGVDWQFSRDASLDVGARRINGMNLPNSYSPPSFVPLFADNLSAAFHYLHAHNEFYLVYGNPNSLSTTPALYFKWIVYAGAQKGT